MVTWASVPQAVLMSEFDDSPVGNRVFIVERDSSMQQPPSHGGIVSSIPTVDHRWHPVQHDQTEVDGRLKAKPG